MKRGLVLAGTTAVLGLVFSGDASAAPPSLDPGTLAGALDKATTPGLAPQLKILAILSLLALLPAIILTMTSFTRTVVVLSFVKQGLGTQQPPNQILIGIALFVTAFTMTPVANRIAKDAYEPYSAGKIDETAAIERAIVPLRGFMLHQTREADLALFYEAAQSPMPRTEEDVSMRMAAPAFVVSELTTAFQMGIMVLLPFLIIDLIVAAVLMSLGMMMMPPQSISLPLKILLFVAVDGWHLLVGSLLRSFS
jgi:flagellar biosynthetic protein FliP